MKSSRAPADRPNSFGRLRDVYDGANLVERYTCDALSRRVRKYDPGETYPYTEYHYDGWRVVEALLAQTPYITACL